MQLRRINKRHRAAWTTPVVAAFTSIAVVAAAAFGGNDILKTQEFGSGPITPMVAEGSFAEGNTIVVDDPAIATQGEGEGPKAVKEFHRDEEFSQFALTWTGEHDVPAFVRAKQADGSWTQWLSLDDIGTEGPGKHGTELIYVGPTHDVQVSVGNIDLYADEAQLADAAAADGRTLPSDLDVVFIDGNAQDGIAPMADLTSGSMPSVVSRAGWGADESMRCSTPHIDDRVNAITLHHTAGLNDYSRAQAAAQVRGIFAYHARTLNWCDIGYNALVDKYGTIYEGRYGGLNKAVQGAHVGGFNSNNWGISMIGNYSEQPPTEETLESVAAMVGWKSAISGINPSGTARLYSGGYRGSKYPAGQTVTVPAFLGHNDLHNTECPGAYTMSYWPQLRRDATQKYRAVEASGGLGSWDWGLDDGLDSGLTTDLDGLTNVDPGLDTGDTNTSSNHSSESEISTAKAVIGIAAALLALAAASNMVNPEGGEGGEGGINIDRKEEVVAGITVEEMPNIISKVVTLTGDRGLAEIWTAILNGFGPVLGLAVGGPTLADVDSQLIYQLFTNGVVLSSKDTGTHALVGEIAKKWAENPEALRLPTSDEYRLDGSTIRVDFQGGYITFDPLTQQAQVFTN